MSRPALSLPDRARGCLVGLAAGHALVTRPAVPGGPDRDGFRPPWPDEVAMAWLLGEELLEAEVDLRRLVNRWIAWWRQDGHGVDQETADALEFLARNDAPPLIAASPDRAGPLARCLPLALAAHAAPASLVSGTYHTVLLTHPAPLTAWSAVAVNVAVATLLHGHRDAMPDVIEALRANDAPPDLLSAVRRVPFIGRDEVLTGDGAVACVEVALWCLVHEPGIDRGLSWVLGRDGSSAAVAGVTAAVLGARDGEVTLPEAWTAGLPELQRLRGLAKRLVTPRSEGL